MEKKSQVSEQNFSEGKALMQCYAMCEIEFFEKLIEVMVLNFFN